MSETRDEDRELLRTEDANTRSSLLAHIDAVETHDEQRGSKRPKTVLPGSFQSCEGR